MRLNMVTLAAACRRRRRRGGRSVTDDGDRSPVYTTYTWGTQRKLALPVAKSFLAYDPPPRA